MFPRIPLTELLLTAAVMFCAWGLSFSWMKAANEIAVERNDCDYMTCRWATEGAE
jgi:hypothetical protein